MNSENENDFDRFVENLQREINEKIKKDFSEHALYLAKNPYKFGKLPDDTKNIFKKLYKGPCGDSILLSLMIEDNIIKDIRYISYGCTTSSIAASQMVKIADGLHIQKALNISQNDILNALGKFPQESEHCALLAINALKKTIIEFKKENKMRSK